MPSFSSSIESEGDNFCQERTNEENTVEGNEELENQYQTSILRFQFDITQTHTKIDVLKKMSPIDVFEKIWDQNVIDKYNIHNNKNKSVPEIVPKLILVGFVSSN